MPLPPQQGSVRQSSMAGSTAATGGGASEGALTALGIGGNDEGAIKLPRGAKSLNALLGEESALLNLLAEPLESGHYPPWVPSTLQTRTTAPRGAEHGLPPSSAAFGRTLRTLDLDASDLPPPRGSPAVATATVRLVVGDWLLLRCGARRDTATGYWSVLSFDERVMAMHAPMHWLPAPAAGSGDDTRQAVRFAARCALSESIISLHLHLSLIHI